MTMCSRTRPLRAWDGLRAVLRTHAAYALLDRTGAHGGTWVTGACGLLAMALHEIIPNSEILDLRDATGRPQHVLIRIDGRVFLDGDGLSLWPTLQRRWITVELRRPPLTVSPHAPAACQRGNIPLDPADVRLVLDYLRQHLIRTPEGIPQFVVASPR